MCERLRDIHIARQTTDRQTQEVRERDRQTDKQTYREIEREGGVCVRD